MQEEEEEDIDNNIEDIASSGDLSPTQINKLKESNKKYRGNNIRSVKSKNVFERLIDLQRRHHYTYISLLEPFQSPLVVEEYRRNLNLQYAMANCSAKLWIFWSTQEVNLFGGMGELRRIAFLKD
ncbi:hypothetical protein H5410_002110 [Solanum commersonii]|uniref:Uncharacterized protein n=1 Tax=Solanum commersonii TaxID=4109 RepID=A0A9J6B121_SOLCO|nr:hypothetical protein H5410_002110 [Solanum commersonii]